MGTELAVNYDMYGMVVSNGTGLSVAPTMTAMANAFTTMTYDLSSALTIDDTDGDSTVSFVEWDLAADTGGDTIPTNDFTEISFAHSSPRTPVIGVYSVNYLTTDGDFTTESAGTVTVLPDRLEGRAFIPELYVAFDDVDFYP